VRFSHLGVTDFILQAGLAEDWLIAEGKNTREFASKREL